MINAKPVILICDDEKENRHHYSEILSKIDNVKIVPVEHPSIVMELLRSGTRIDVILMDLYYQPSSSSQVDMGMIGHKYLPEIRRDFPNIKIVVVTKMGPNAYDIIVECEKKKLHDAWIDVGKVMNRDEIKARVEPLIYPHGIVSRSGVWLIQMSDLHFGNSALFKLWGLAEDGSLLQILKTDILESIPNEYPEFNRKIDLLVLTGDLTHHARDEQYDKVEIFIRELTKNVIVPNTLENNLERVIVIPGNHEVNYDISRARSISVGTNNELSLINVTKEEDVPTELKYLRKYVWAPFDNFCAKMKFSYPFVNNLWNKDKNYRGATWTFPELGLIVYGINSAANGIDHFTNTPNINPDIVWNLKSETISLNKSSYPLPNILLSHHSLGSTTSDKERVNDKQIAELRKAFFKNLDIRLFLTGHIHQEIAERISVEGKDLLFIGAGSASAASSEVPDREPLQYNLINIHPGSKIDNSPDRIYIYSRILFKDEFIAHPKYPKLNYRWDNSSGWILMNDQNVVY